MLRRLRKFLLLAFPLAILMGCLWILGWGSESHRGNLDYLRWKYGLGPYRRNIVPELLWQDHSLRQSCIGKDQAWIFSRFPELSPSPEFRGALRSYFNCPKAEVYQVGKSQIFVVIDQEKCVAITPWKDI